MRCAQGWKRKKLWGGAGKPECEEKNSTNRSRSAGHRTAHGSVSHLGVARLRRGNIAGLRSANIARLRPANLVITCFVCPRSVSEGCVRVRCPQNVIIVINATMLIAIRQTNPMRIMHQGYTKAQGACLGINIPPPIVRLRPTFLRGFDPQVLRFYKAPICQQWQLRPSV